MRKVIRCNLGELLDWSLKYEVETVSSNKYIMKIAELVCKDVFQEEAVGWQAMHGRCKSKVFYLLMCIYWNFLQCMNW